jgi:hypothetical protein
MGSRQFLAFLLIYFHRSQKNKINMHFVRPTFKYFLCLFTLISFSLTASKFQLDLNGWEIPTWIQDQLVENFAPFIESGITKHSLDATIAHSPSWCGLDRCQFIDGKYYGAQNHPFKIILKNTLEFLHEKYGLPNLDFIFNGADGGYKSDARWVPLSWRAPIFASAKATNISGIILFIDTTIPLELSLNEPFYEPFKGLDEIDIPWESKIDMAIWRGAASDGLDPGCVDMYNVDTWSQFPRAKLHILSKHCAEILDAGIVHYYPLTGDPAGLERVNPTVPSKSIQEHLLYKYQITADGNVCTYGYPWRLYSKSLVFKQDSNQVQWYYKGLKPFVHYVPVKNDFSDLIDMILWARNNDNLCKQIAEQGRDFAQKNLNAETYMRYVYLVLINYAKLQRFTPKSL